MKEKLLIVAATKFELSKTIEHFHLPEQDFVSHRTFDILFTGVGMTATAFALGRHLPGDYTLVLNVGIAGSFDHHIPLGTLVDVQSDTLSELGAEDHDLFLTIDELGFGTNTYSASALVTPLAKVKGITVNTVHGRAETIELALQRFKPQTESMEGAAVFFACHQLSIPCAQVRAISNFVTPRNRDAWQIGLAIQNLNDWLINFLIASTADQIES